MIEWFTFEFETALTSCAPALINPCDSVFWPTINPVTLCRKIIGMFEELHSRMNCVDLFASGTKMTGCALAMIPVRWPELV
jgi:hypothetical protein